MRLTRPTRSEIAARLSAPGAPFSYAEVGATRDLGDATPGLVESGYDVDRRPFPMGTGRERFERVRDALLSWRHFDVPWLTFHGASAPPTAGQAVAVLVRVAGLWLLNPCRVVWVDRPEAGAEAVAFAYGTLSGHAERGEERFRVSLDPASGDVTYEIASFSRPGTLLTRLGYPFARRFQRRFAEASAAALARASDG